jgi:hypothetical protein
VYRPGQAASNLVTVPIDPATRRFTLFNAVGHADVIVDVVGFYATDQGDQFVPTTPARVLDTRPHSGQPGADHTLGPDETLPAGLAGVGPIPPTRVDAAVLNLTVVGGSDIPSASYLTVWPHGVARPLAANVVYRPGQLVAVQAVAGAGFGGSIDLYNAYGHADVIADTAGWFTP